MNTIQKIFRDHAPQYLKRFGHTLSKTHRKVIDAVCQCRTGARGHHLFECPNCRLKHRANSSCGNRHCPVCQNDKAAHWTHRQQLRLLPCTYFLATFTLPQPLKAIAQKPPRTLYGALFQAAKEALETLQADPRFVGCNIAGFFAVLHTWGRQLQYHPHVHCVIAGGGLSAERDRWIPASPNFLVHVRALSRLFRGKMKAALRNAGLLQAIPSSVWQQEWVVHCQAVGDGRAVMKYLGVYVFRVAISNARIVAYNGSTVTFTYRKVGSRRPRRCTLTALQFLRRFLQHVLPAGFMKIRHYGFLSPNFSVPIQKIREMISILYELLRHRPANVKPPQKPKPPRCSICGTVLVWRCFLPPLALFPSGP